MINPNPLPFNLNVPPLYAPPKGPPIIFVIIGTTTLPPTTTQRKITTTLLRRDLSPFSSPPPPFFLDAFWIEGEPRRVTFDAYDWLRDFMLRGVPFFYFLFVCFVCLFISVLDPPFFIYLFTICEKKNQLLINNKKMIKKK